MFKMLSRPTISFGLSFPMSRKNRPKGLAMAKLIHSMVRVLNETRSIEFYEKAFGLKVSDRYVFDTFTIVYMRSTEADFEIELTVNHGRDKPYDVGDGVRAHRVCGERPGIVPSETPGPGIISNAHQGTYL